MSILNRLFRYVKRKRIKIELKLHQRCFVHNNTRLKYLFYKKNADRLIIIFSGMSNKARFNYVNTLREVDADRLYILDDFGEDKLGCYYIGTNGKKEVYDAVIKLIETISTKRNSRTEIYVGSSKGGYAALIFGLQRKNSSIIAGAPQYYLGYYLSHRTKPNLLNTVLGKNTDDQEIQRLDRILPDIIRKNCFAGKVYLHYSNQEHTYYEHISFLVRDLKENGIEVIEDIADYKVHNQVAEYFPPYLVEVIGRIANH